jgi:cytoskeleton protein RodZ
MENFSEYLRKQREEKRIRLSDIAVQTRISLNFLEAIETGNFEILPETYIRAFIRDYAKTVGLDVDETMRHFDEHVEAKKAAVEEQVETSVSEKAKQTTITLTSTQKIFAGIIGLGILVGLSYLAFSPSRKQPVDINAYESMEEVNQRKFDSAYTVATAKPAAKADSARLVLSANDTVWVNLVIDEGKTFDLLMRPGNRFTFWGRRKFNMTIGNAGGLIVSLNGRQYPPLGKPGVVIRNVTIFKDGSIKK